MWDGWTAARALYLGLGIAFLALFVQVTLYHMRQNFRHPSMWLPVIATPIVGLLAVSVTMWNAPVLKTMLAWVSGITALASVYGTYMHSVGVSERVGGVNVNNAMIGPPIMLPLLLATLSVLALIAVYLL